MYAVEMENITKTFGSLVANHKVSFKIHAENIHAIVGENGAGKSTIMNILYGIYHPDEGEIKLCGKSVTLDSPLEAIRHNIGMVHQHFKLVMPFSVAENIVLGMEDVQHRYKMDLKSSIKKIKQISDEYGLKIDPESIISDLSVGQQQKVEILKVLYRGADVLILDEPTAVLTPLEVQGFFKILKKLKAQGKTIVIITHKLKEVIAISDEVTVMKQGKVVDTKETAEVTIEDLARMMVGREVLFNLEKYDVAVGKTVLKVEDLSYEKEGKKILKNLHLEVHAGEIVGIAGIAGNGQTEFIEILSGMKSPSSGKIIYLNEDVSHQNAHQRRTKKICHVPSDRLKHGFVKIFTNRDNLILGYHFLKKYLPHLFFDFKKIEVEAQANLEQYLVTPSDSHMYTKNLSGGNQQKLVIAREFAQDPDFLIIAEPTRGVDIGAIEFIHNQIFKMKARKKAILLFSSELDEIYALCDRAFVFFEGRNVGKIDLDHFDEMKLGLLMTGNAPAAEAIQPAEIV